MHDHRTEPVHYDSCPVCGNPALWLDIRCGKRFCSEHLPEGLDEYLAAMREIGALPKHEPHYEHHFYENTYPHA